MTTKKIHTAAPDLLRATADAAVAKWRGLESAAVAARSSHSTFMATRPFLGMPGDRSSEELLRSLELRRFALEGEEAAEQARHAAASALDEVEVAEGDALALARDPKRLYDDLTALADEAEVIAADVRTLQEKVADVDRRSAERWTRARVADVELGPRRKSEAAPPSCPLPRPGVGRYLAVLGERVEKGAPVTSRAGQIAACREREEKVAADLEVAALEEQERKEEVAAQKAARDRAFANQQKESQRRLEAVQAENAAVIQRQGKLAADHRVRRAS